MRHSALLSISVTSLFLCSCATTRIRENYYTLQKFRNYTIGKPKTASIGDAMIELERASVRDAYVAIENIIPATLGVQETAQRPIFQGERFTVIGVNPQDTDEVFIRLENLPPQVQFISIHKNGTIFNGWVFNDGTIPTQSRWKYGKLFAKASQPTKGEESFKTQLIYSGMLGNNIKVIYREFSNDYARPSFTQEVQYNLEESKEIAYKTIKMTILKATNQKIEFQVDGDAGNPWFPN